MTQRRIPISIVVTLTLAAIFAGQPALAAPPADHAAPASVASARPVFDASDATTTLTQNQLWLALANYGSIGNVFIDRTASLEYPGGAGFEHLTIAGIWIGARTRDGSGAFTGVSTAAEDAFLGVPTSSRTEFTASAADFIRRSAQPASPFYSPVAVSDLDVIAGYADTPVRNGSTPASRPLNVAVRQSAYAWSLPALQDVVFLHYVIVAQGDTLHDVWVGQFAEMASGFKTGYVNWPPDSDDPSGLGAWFSKKLVIWDAAARTLREHYCRALPAPDACFFEVAPPWIGLQLLTPPRLGQSLTVAAWAWSPGAPPHNTDPGRYALMSAETVADFTSAPLAPVTGDPVEVLALGPFPTIAPGDSIAVDFAFVGGADESALHDHAANAQIVRDAGFNPSVLAVPPRAGASGLRIHGLRPNPASGSATRLAFELPVAGDVTLEIIDVAGRVVLEREWSGLGPGAHAPTLGMTSSLAPGVYLVRLSQAGRVATGRVVMLR
jgi:hypothetical protein